MLRLATEYGSRFYYTASNAKCNTNMEELRTLTAGQKAVVDAYLAQYEPADAFDFDSTVLIDTQTMINDMNTMCFFDENMLCDYLAEEGYRAHYESDDALSGWILKPIE